MTLAVRLRKKILSSTALLGAVALACTGCSTTSPAASVDGAAISQDQLNQQLQWLVNSPAYVKEFDQEQAQAAAEAQAQAQQSGQNPASIQAITVGGTGTGPGTFSTSWVGIQLSRLIDAEAVHQQLLREHRTPTRLELSTAWATEQAAQPQIWLQYAPQLRAVFALEDAEHALVEGTAKSAKADQQFYNQYKEYYWSKVCVLEADISVPGRDDSVNMAASKSQADADVKALESGGPSPFSSGARYCLTPQGLIQKTAAFFSHVGALSPGKAVAIAGPSGYQVVKVLSRAVIPYNNQTQLVIDVLNTWGGSRGVGTADSALISLLQKADVQVNPRYGAWDPSPPAETGASGQSEPTAPRVLPPLQATI